MTNMPSDDADREFISLKALARRWDCSRSTVRRILQRAGVRAYFLNDSRNGTLRYRYCEVLEYEGKSKERKEDH